VTKQRNQGVLTDELYYRDAQTNTKYKKAEIAIQTEKDISKMQGDSEEDEYDEEEETHGQGTDGNKKALAKVDMDRLAEWLNAKYPKVKQILDANLTQRAFDSYEVFWEDERGEINEMHALRTDFDFKEANKAVQKALNKLKEVDGSAGDSTQADSSNYDEWGEETQSNAASSKQSS